MGENRLPSLFFFFFFKNTFEMKRLSAAGPCKKKEKENCVSSKWQIFDPLAGKMKV